MLGVCPPPTVLVAPLGLALCALIAGCQQEDPIQPYLVLKDERVQEIGRRKLATKDRLLVAMFRQAGQGWFFKLVGPRDQVTRHAADFHQLIRSVRFAPGDTGPPTWTLPAGWQSQTGGGGMRHATLQIPAEQPPLAVTVVALGIRVADQRQYLLENLNRWRDQLQLPAVDLADLSSHLEELEVDGQPAVIVDLLGNLAVPQGNINRPDLVRRGPATDRPRGPATAARRPREGHDPSVLECQPPAGWQPARLGPLDKAHYQVREGQAQLDISVRSAGGRLLDNVNRWRRQIQLGPLDAAALAAALQPLTVADQEGKYIEIRGPDAGGSAQAIYGVVVDIGPRTWFVKLQGDADLAAREKQNFRTFAESLRFKSG